MTRSLWKGKFCDANLLRKIYFLKKLNLLDKKTIIIFERSTIIIPILVGVTVLIYNGKKFIKLLITDKLIGFRFSEFAFTKRLGNSIHNSGILKQKNKKRN